MSFLRDQLPPHGKVQNEAAQARYRIRRLADPIEVFQQSGRVHRSNASERMSLS